MADNRHHGIDSPVRRHVSAGGRKGGRIVSVMPPPALGFYLTGGETADWTQFEMVTVLAETGPVT